MAPRASSDAPWDVERSGVAHSMRRKAVVAGTGLAAMHDQEGLAYVHELWLYAAQQRSR